MPHTFAGALELSADKGMSDFRSPLGADCSAAVALAGLTQENTGTPGKDLRDGQQNGLQNQGD